MVAEPSIDVTTRRYVQYGSGTVGPATWQNFDASPTLRIQRTPLLGRLLRSKLNVVFPKTIAFGDITKALPGVVANSCDGVYCSHVLEHLALDDFRAALQNTYLMLRPGGIFRLVVPDLEYYARNYLARLNEGDPEASLIFGRETLLGQEVRPRGMRGLIATFWGNSHHRWMWDYPSLARELAQLGFTSIRRASFNDAADPMFADVEEASRFENCLAIECRK
jgi:SAM-dependent methyltransferase